jgi:hypothetical protein
MTPRSVWSWARRIFIALALTTFVVAFAGSFTQRIVYVTGQRTAIADVYRNRALWQGRFEYQRIDFAGRWDVDSIASLQRGQFFLAPWPLPTDRLLFTKIAVERGNPWANLTPPPPQIPDANGVFFAIPLWPLVIASTVCIVRSARRGWIDTRGTLRRRKGRCSNCGFDLRASPERCPECGTPASGATA